MDSIRVSKVEHVACTKSGSTLTGTIHLTAHHLIFQYDEDKEKELWVPYPLISLVTCLPQTIQGQCPLTFNSRTFETFTVSFMRESDAIDVFESVKELTVATSVQQLYAFFYIPKPPFPRTDGWSLYSSREEFGRMGVGTRSKAWRFTDINKDYSFCSTYPARLVVPTRISDTTLQYASKYRSKCRIPVLSYLHWSNYGSITRSSQPMVGITQNRSIQDEKLIEAIFHSHHSPESRASKAPVYGAMTTNLIIDARPTTNAVANTAKGAGTENMDHYKEGKKVYLGIDHIHTMRESLAKVVEALREAETTLASISTDLSSQVAGISVLDRQALRRSGWLRHISAILEGTAVITRNVHVNSSHVLIHCSDGWDRTSQLSSLAQLCLDPFYRTIRGFEILVEKDWLSYGHKFLDRCGHLSSDKFFISTLENTNTGSGADAAQAFLASMQNRFASQNHIKETSPVFHQFLESVRQIQRQFPERFEFNERFLHQLYYHLYSCQFGTFLFNCERERRMGDGDGPPPCERTVSVWDFFNSPSEMEQNRNAAYDPSLDDPMNRSPKSDMGVLLPNPKDVRFWHELYGRTDEEMNGRLVTVQALGVEATVESSQDNPIQRTNTPSFIPLPPSPSKSPAHSLAPSRSTSISVAPRSISPIPSSSAPTMESHPLPGPPSRVDSFKPFGASTSAISMKPANSSTTSTSSSNRVTPKPPDFFGSGGVKSVWGKLSSNASAAFSAVQEAYVGLSQDPRRDDTKTEELRGRDNLNAWGESVPSQLMGSNTINPWSTIPSSASSPTLPSPFDNPWTSTRGSPLKEPETFSELLNTGSLPLDPTVSPALRSPHPRGVDENLDRLTLTESSLKAQETPPQTPGSSNTDPLGVGLF
ncbi:protein phosphatase [Desarmillaria tabescens]|uniref:Protein phosphatase n=1 Tax=Armillaria tabescens TaxID=1929756 RepID=A0AA39NDY2_ARMTA|nr:protein phosphatase [Desarmillaria tabescens]KAK0463836.1 protein phosphatase [Desarmillaria tabescens]